MPKQEEKFYEEVSELKKYEIYLDLKKKLEENNDPNIFNGVKNKSKILNINTLDNYSLKDIKKIRENLKRSQSFSCYLENEGTQKVLKRD